MSILAMALYALTLWSHKQPMEFRIQEIEPSHYAPGVIAAAAPLNKDMTICGLWANSADLAGLDPELQQNMITHEVGHCVGLDHPKSDDQRQSIMREIAGGITRVDVLNYQRIWGRPRYSYAVPNLVSDNTEFIVPPVAPVHSPVPEPLTLEQIVAQYPWDLQEAHNIIWCESKWDIWAVNPDSGACGLWQHLPCEGLGDAEVSTSLAWAKYEARGWQPWTVGGCFP